MEPNTLKTLPEGLTPYRRTPVFTEESVPVALTKNHKTKSVVWGVIHVTSGRLRYTIPSSNETIELKPGIDGIVEPDVQHYVTPFCAVGFYVEFWR